MSRSLNNLVALFDEHWRETGSKARAVLAILDAYEDMREQAMLTVGEGSSKVRAVIARAADEMRIPVCDILGDSRTGSVADARAVAMWALRASGMSYPAIGRVLHRHHASVMAAVRKVTRDQALLTCAQRVVGERESRDAAE